MPLAHTPIAFKGPSDHLSKFFEPALIYKAILLLLSPEAPEDDEFAEVNYFEDWFYDREESLVSATIQQENSTNLDLSLSWPIDASSLECHCKQAKPCEHLAALAIESKMRLDKLPTTLKDAQASLPSWTGLLAWQAAQSHDPYPNMARHRLAYIFDIQDQECIIQVQKAYLTKKGEYQNKAEFELDFTNNRNKPAKAWPKFVSLIDRQIFQSIQQLNFNSKLQVLSKSSFSLALKESFDLLKLIQSCQRLFWKACFRSPLNWQFQAADQQEPEVIAKLGSSILKIDSALSINKASNSLVQTVPAKQALLKALADIKTLPLGRFVKPLLKIESHQTDLRAFSQAPIQINCARLYITFNKQQYNLDELIEQQAYLSQSANGLKLLKYAAKINHKLNWLDSITSKFELPISQHFNSSDRYLESDIGQWAPLIPALHALDWEIHFASNFYLNQLEADDWYLNVDQSQQDWFKLEVGVSLQAGFRLDGSDNESEHNINLLPYLVKAFQNGANNFETVEKQLEVNERQLSIQLDTGENILVEKSRVKHIFSILVELLDQAPLNEEQQLELPQVQVNRLAQFDAASLEGTNETDAHIPFEWHGSQELKQQALKLTNIKEIAQVEAPASLNATLRHYQQEGLNWLQFLSHNNLGGILADDMGLGKTIQTLAHILLEKEAGAMQNPCLIVVPTSLINNWQSEAERFAPSLKVLILAGNKRHHHFEQLHDYDLLIMSYGTVLRDIEVLQSYNFHLLILDEAQAIKNSRSKISQQVIKIKSAQRLCLTGTPMENHLGELWSLFNFLMPQFLGTLNQFKRHYQEPIEKQQDTIRQQDLAQRIAPFMLRRTKDKVATELPDKVEINQIIELETEQAELYETIRLSMSNEIQKIVQSDSGKANQLLISNALLRLRQICCHPQLTPFEAAQNNQASAKLSWLKSQLPIMIEEGRKILLFSSFTSMLDIIASQLQEMDIPYLMLTGKSQKRGELVDSFQQSEIPVFLISLKAGGSGLNLTAADTVIHFDPWWNPAAEQQASDRAHRIGQDKSVFVYKLISKDTVEQRILQLQQRKEQLATKLYQANSNQAISLADIDWQELLKPLEG